jgi:histone deacetylase complex regulatory component SIN3
MRTIRLHIDDKIYDRFIRILEKFSQDEIKIVNEDALYAENKLYLEKELDEMIEGKATFVTLEEAEQRLEHVIRNNENNP